jgi:transposase
MAKPLLLKSSFQAGLKHVMLAVVTTHEGLLFSYQLFPGNTLEEHTLLHMVEELKKSSKDSQITLVADRGMFTRDNGYVSEMLKNHKLSRAISELDFYELRRHLEYGT